MSISYIVFEEDGKGQCPGPLKASACRPVAGAGVTVVLYFFAFVSSILTAASEVLYRNWLAVITELLTE